MGKMTTIYVSPTGNGLTPSTPTDIDTVFTTLIAAQAETILSMQGLYEYRLPNLISRNVGK